MAKYCSNCGAEFAQGSKFCASCGANFEGKTSETSQTGYQIQQPSQPRVYTPTGQPPRKSNTKLMAVVAIIVVAIVVIAAVILIFFVGGSSNNFVGKWNIISGSSSSMPSGSTMTFEGNGDLKATYENSSMTIGKWSIEGGRLCIQASSSISGSGPSKACVSYSFSDDGRTLRISPPTGSGSDQPLILSKQ
jgi:DNA-directed RNA polymerase subunit RPC12/RpoP